MSGNLQLFLRLTADGSGLSRVVSRSASEIKAFGRTAAGAFNTAASAMQRLNAQLNGFSSLTRMAMASGGFLSMRAGINGAIELEKAMLGVKANIMSGVGSASELQKQLLEVRQTARELSKQTIFSDADMVNISAQLLKSGVRLQDIKGQNGAAYATAALSQLGGIAPETAAGQMGSLGNAFSFKSPAQYKALADQIIRVDDASAMKSSDILYNSQLVSASAAQLKIDPKRMVSALGYLDPLGNMAGTSLNRFLEGLAGTTKPKRKALKESGLDFWQKNSDGTTTLKDFGTVIEMTRKKFQSMKSDQDKLTLGHKLFGEEGARAAAFFSSKEMSFADFEAQVEKSASAADKLKVNMEGLGAQLARLKNSAFAELEKGAPMKASGYLVGALADLVENGHLAKMIVAGVGALMVGRLGWKSLNGSSGGRPGGGLPGVGGAQPVYVTNWPGSVGGMTAPGGSTRPSTPGNMGPLLGATPAPPGKWATRAGRFGSGFKTSAGVGGTMALVTGGLEVTAIRSDDSLNDTQKNAQTGRVIAGTTGAAAGAAIGGGVGALFGGVGAIPGALIGGAIGQALGEWLVKEDVASAMKRGDDEQASVAAEREAARETERQQIELAQKQLEALEKLVSRPVQVNINGREVTAGVNEDNARTAKRH